MSSYTPVYSRPYEDGFVNAPPYKTPITDEVLNSYDRAIENIEDYLKENPIGGGDVANVDASVSYGILSIQLCSEDGKVVSEKRVTLPSIDLSNGVTHAVVHSLISRNNISMNRKAGTEVGSRSVAVGSDVTASGYCAHAEGENTESAGEAAHAEGRGTKALENYSHAEGQGTTADGYYSHAEGSNTTAGGQGAHAEGQGTTASGYSAHAEGLSTTASGQGAHAEGQGTTASKNCAHAEGINTTAVAQSAHAEGLATIASGQGAHAEGEGTNAAGSGAHAEGSGTIAAGQSQHVQGRCNIEDVDGKYAHIVGNGQSADSRSNGHTLDWEGNAWYSGTVESAGIILRDNTDKSQYYKIQISDGQLVVEQVPGSV